MELNTETSDKRISEEKHSVILDRLMKSGMIATTAFELISGGLFGALLMVYLICRIRKQNFADLSDILTVGIPLFHCFGRVGCFFAGCCYGVESNSWIAFHGVI